MYFLTLVHLQERNYIICEKYPSQIHKLFIEKCARLYSLFDSKLGINSLHMLEPELICQTLIQMT